MFKIDTELLNLLFSRLKENSIKFLVLRNHEGLPDCTNAKDVDVLVSNQLSPSRINCIILELCAKSKAKLIWLNELDYLSGFALARVLDDGSVAYVKLDFFYGLRWRGLDFLDSEHILAKRVSVDDFYIPDAGHEAAIHLVNGLLYGKQLNNKYDVKIDTGFVEKRESFYSLLAISGLKVLIKDFETLIEAGFDKRNDSKYLNEIRGEIVKGIIQKQLSFSVMHRFLSSVKCELVNRRGFGYLISFSGPDGAGKSSIVDYVLDFFRLTGICKQESAHHFLPIGIRPLHSLIRVNKKLSNQDYTQPYSEKTVGKLSSIVRFLYYVLAFGYAKQKYIKPQLRNNEVVIFDRYYPDIIADPARARLSISRRAIKFIISRVAARPDVAMVFVASPDILIERKGELSETKAIQLIKDYRKICISSDFELVENDGTLNEGLALTFSALFEKLNLINIKKI